MTGRTEREPRAKVERRGWKGPGHQGGRSSFRSAEGKSAGRTRYRPARRPVCPREGEPVTRVVPRIMNSSLLDARTFFIILRNRKTEA